MTRWRAVFILLCVLLISTGALAGQARDVTPIAGVDTELLRWAVTQGGLTLVVVLLIVNEIRRSGALAAALREATAALASSAEVARQQASSFTRLAESVRLCEAVRELVREKTE